MTYIMSCVWLDYMVKYFQCKNCVGSSPKTKKCVASFLVPGDSLSVHNATEHSYVRSSPIGLLLISFVNGKPPLSR